MADRVWILNFPCEIECVLDQIIIEYDENITSHTEAPHEELLWILRCLKGRLRPQIVL